MLFCKPFGLICKPFGLICKAYGLICKAYGLICKPCLSFGCCYRSAFGLETLGSGTSES